MAYHEQIIDQIQQASDIVEVISACVPLKRTGRNFKANCPFHHEKTPSFIVSPDRQIFHCFGCGAGGDVFSFLMKHEQMNFPEAVRHLADRARIPLPESEKQVRSERSENDRLYQICQVATEFYHAQLMNPEMGKQGRAYLSQRGFGPDEIKEFQLGLATQEWRALLQHVIKKEFSEREYLRSGLISKSAQGNTFDLFRNRIMFPIMNAQGKVIAFGGRVLNDDLPKYLNSPETPIFKKRRELYALNIAKRTISGTDAVRQILITEGYLDAIRLHANGFKNTVATLGTSLTEDHVRVLKRYADESIVVFDGDRAGEQASLRSLDIFLEEGMGIRVLSLPRGFDPDDFVRAKGQEAMKQLIRESQDIFDFKLQVLLRRFNKSDSMGLLKITSEFLDTLSKLKNFVLVDRCLKRLAATLGVEEASLRSELAKLQKKQQGTQKSEAVPVQTTASNLQADRKGNQLERVLLSLLLHYPPYLLALKEAFPNFSFLDNKLNRIFSLMDQMVCVDQMPEISTSKVLNRINDEELKALVSSLLAGEWLSHENREQAFQDCLRALKKEEHSKRLRALRNRISQAEDQGDENLVLKYMKDYQTLLSEEQ